MPGDGQGKREVYIEFVLHGGLLKATAIDSVTGTEASVFGPATAPRSALAYNAAAKLAYVLKKREEKSE